MVLTIQEVCKKNVLWFLEPISVGEETYKEFPSQRCYACHHNGDLNSTYLNKGRSRTAIFSVKAAQK